MSSIRRKMVWSRKRSKKKKAGRGSKFFSGSTKSNRDISDFFYRFIAKDNFITMIW